ncbi:MAG: redoxin family protein [Armatimonadetes bacterium]|nr:redoxin family protein [Armatimonadota bacterium]
MAASLALLLAHVLSPSLAPGDAAPPLAVRKWLQGEPMATFAPGKVHVVEFWASWCGPCKVEMPHLVGLAKKYEGKVTFVGVSVWDNPADAEKSWAVAGNPIPYRLAEDKIPDNLLAEKDPAAFARRSMSEGAMSSQWLVASGLEKVGIPAAFIVNQSGRIAWAGNPSRLDKPLDAVLAGKWDIDAARRDHIDLVTETDLLGKAMADWEKRIEAKQDAEAVKEATDFAFAKPKYRALLLAQVFGQLYVQQRDADAASKLARRALPLQTDPDNDPLPTIAYSIAFKTPADLKPDLALGMQVAKQADKNQSGKHPGVKESLAQLAFLQGDLKGAVKYQSEAIAIRPSDSKKKRLAELQAALSNGG